MPKQYTKDELWKLYEKLPQELKEAVFAQETADHIFNVCERNNVNEVSKVAANVGLVLMGVLLPSEFEKTIAEDLGLDEQTAKSVAAEINRFVFYPVRPALEKLHEVAMATEATKATKEAATPAPQTEAPAARPQPEERAQNASGGADAYRETIE